MVPWPFWPRGRLLGPKAPIPPKITHVAAATISATSTHGQGNIAGIYVGNVEERNDITDELTAGQLKGLVDLRDKVLPNMQSQLDELAAEPARTHGIDMHRGTVWALRGLGLAHRKRPSGA